MEPIFQVETAHDTDAYNNMVTAHYMRHQKNSIKALYALGVVLGLCIWLMVSGGNLRDLRALGTGIFFLALILLLVPYLDRFAALQVCKRMLRSIEKAARKNKIYALPTRYRFYEDHLDASDNSGTVETPYTKVKDLVETEDYFLLFLESSQCILARKKDFTLGDADGFQAFIAGACGRELAFFPMPRRRRR